MIVIRFDTWCDCRTKKYHYSRYYIKNHKWTPFCRKETHQAHIKKLCKLNPEKRSYYELIYGYKR